jgi:GH15 family glucan-1,4-alpha-glucosidase
MVKQPLISQLAVLSDQRTCAILDQDGTLNWYCPRRFDEAAVFSLLVDDELGGYWAVDAPGKRFQQRAFVTGTSVLQTTFLVAGGTLTLTDWLPLNGAFQGLVRTMSAAPAAVTFTLRLRPEYGQRADQATAVAGTSAVFLHAGLWLYASHPLEWHGHDVSFTVPAGEAGWAFLSEAEKQPTAASLQTSRLATEAAWQLLAAAFQYEGLYEREVLNSVRAIQQVTYAATGGVLAAATIALPEVIGAERNYDYRYVWMRDLALITGALSTLDIVAKQEFRFLDFVAAALQENQQASVTPLYRVDHHLVKGMQHLKLGGYWGSQPVLIGNTASDQRQLDAEANVLIAAHMLYSKYGEQPHWAAVAQIADYICHNWDKKDNGIWEEGVLHHYTSSKVFAALGLELVADYNPDPAEAARWRHNAGLIRTFVAEHCLTKTGAYASYAGSEEVDVSAALFALWSYTEPDAPAMQATIQELEATYCREQLYWRRLEEYDSRKEGAFLAGSCWMAHYYAVAGNLPKSQAILDAVARFQNDLGYFSEEADVDKGLLLGNFAQSFVHSSFICAANGLTKAYAGIDTRVRPRSAAPVKLL